MTKEFDNSDKIDNLEQRLYSPKNDIQVRNRKKLREKEYIIASDWERPQDLSSQIDFSANKPKKNWFITFFILAFIFFIGAAGFVGYKFIFEEGIDAKNVDILVNAPLTIGAGEILVFDVLLQNKNQINMNTVDMTIEFPDGSRSVEDISKNKSILRDELGSINVGSVLKNNYNVLLFGDEGDKKEIVVSISYRVEGSNLIIEKEKKFEVLLKSTPIRMNVTNVKEITSGQNLKFNIELVSNSTQVLSNVIVQATYPFGFSYQGSSIAAEDNNRTWIVPLLSPGEIVNFTVEGVLEGQNNEERYFSFVTGLEDEKTGNPQVVFNNAGTTITLKRPFLELDFAIDRKSEDIIILDPNTIYNADIEFKNNTDIQLRNAIVKLNIEGPALNKQSVQASEGFYQSINNTIVFDDSTTNKLKNIPVGSSGGVNFSFSGSSNKEGGIIVNPELTVNAWVEANRNPDNQVSELIENSITKKIRFNTQIRLEPFSEYYSSTFSNSGPIPPKVEQKTTYTAVFELSNTSNKISEGIVTGKLPNYVTFEGAISPVDSDVTYDPKTRIVTWKVGGINEKTGYLGNFKKRAAFQVGLQASVSQAGTAPNLVTDVVFTGVDTYTKQNITKSNFGITTSIVNSKTLYDSQVSR